MSTKKISELETTSAVSTSDLMETAIPSGSSYASKKMSIAQLATYLENSVVHSALDTQNKTIIDAINELKSICDSLSASHFIVANQLPTSDINMNAIYLIPKQSTGVNDVYEEYICLDDTTTPATWEKIGETQIDLSNYITFDDADIATTSKNGSMSKADRSKMNGIESGAQKNVQSDWSASSGDAFIKNKPTIPDELADLTDDSTHRVVTDSEKSTWNDNRAVSEIRLTNEDLDNVTTVGFYYAAGGNTCANKPTVYNNFGLVVIHNASGSQYTQIISNEDGSHRRIKKNGGTWSAWAKDNFTDETVKQVNVTTGAYYVLFGKTNTLDTETDYVQKNGGIKYYPASANLLLVRQHTATTAANTRLEIGNNIAVGTAGNVYATLRLYGRGAYRVDITDSDNVLTADRVLKLPNIDGTIATNSDAVMWTQQNILGAKNLITFPYYHGFSRTTNNVVFTVDNDGIITVGGTQASGNASFYLMYNVKLPNGTYTLSDGGVGTADTYLSCVYYTTPSASAQYYDVTNNGSVTFTVNNWDRAVIRIWSRSGKTADNLVFKPMLRLTSIIDDTWKPYAETNYNLTVGKLNSNNVATIERTDTASKAYSVGDYMVWRSQLYRVTTAIASGGTISGNVASTDVGTELKRIVNPTWNYASGAVTKSAWSNVCADSALEVQIYFDSTAVLGAYNYTNSIFIPVSTIPTSGTNTYSVFYFKTTSSNAYISFDLKREGGYVKMKLYEVYSNGSSYSGSGSIYFNCYYR